VKDIRSLPRLKGRLALPEAAIAMYCLSSTAYDAGPVSIFTARICSLSEGVKRQAVLTAHCHVGQRPTRR
jgi:hypothetical protein